MAIGPSYAMQEHQRLAAYLGAMWQGYAEGRLNIVDWAIAVMEQHRHCHEVHELGLSVQGDQVSQRRGEVAVRGIERLEQWLDVHGYLDAKSRNLISEVVERVVTLLDQPPLCICETVAPPAPGVYY